MSKYDTLTAYLESLTTASRRMRFDEIEHILGFGLPASARRHQAWWANDDRDGRQSAGWLSAGWLPGSASASRPSQSA